MNNGETVPVASLRLLAPPLRLVSAAMWKVMQQRDAMHYGKLEEFVTSVSETVPGLLSYRHQAKLVVGLQARLILEQLGASQSPDPELILSHLKRLRAPTLPVGKGKDQKVQMAVKNFHSLVQTLLKNPEERRRFFQEDFDSQYGPHYETALEKLLWEFLTRLDQLLPVPDLTETASWLAGAPAVLEECARAASQPQLLRTLLKHERCLGHLDPAASIPSSTGDSILSSLSLPPSGRVQHPSHQSRSTTAANWVPSPGLSTQRSKIGQRRETRPPIAPVIGSISGEDLPQSTPANDNTVSILEQDTPRKELCGDRKRRDGLDDTCKASKATPGGSSPGDSGPPSNLSSCMKCELRVVVTRLDIRDVTQPVLLNASVGEEQTTKSPRDQAINGVSRGRNGNSVTRKRKLSNMLTPQKHLSSVTDQQTSAVSPIIPLVTKEVQVRMASSERNSSRNQTTDDIIIDSEDEAIQNVKGRLFKKCYSKTKNNTYVPTLREFWRRPFYRDLVSPGNGSR
ncbi:TERF1-interacting nuclear factor 2 [Brachyhypopomus gauderio]|uniref:TERF1-interacting nuclear factor 2 n=1 Tax=Brachyhypopomus gauderio TaxID=698409 RepID=UPI0040438A11